MMYRQQSAPRQGEVDDIGDLVLLTHQTPQIGNRPVLRGDQHGAVRWTVSVPQCGQRTVQNSADRICGREGRERVPTRPAEAVIVNEQQYDAERYQPGSAYFLKKY